MHAVLSSGKEHTFECLIVGFAASAREDDLLGLAAQKSSYLTSRLFNCLSCLLTGPVVAGRVTERPLEQLLHGISNFGCERRAGVEVEVYALMFGRAHEYPSIGFWHPEDYVSSRGCPSEPQIQKIQLS